MRDITILSELPVNQISPLVDEVLTKSDLDEISKHCVIYPCTFNSWDGDKHYGAYVACVDDNDDFQEFFMERTYEDSPYPSNDKRTFYKQQVWHKLMPVTPYAKVLRNRFHKRFNTPLESMSFADYIIMNSADDYEYSDSVKLSYRDLIDIVEFKKSAEEVHKIERELREAVNALKQLKVPAGDDRWDELIFNGELRREVFGYINSNTNHFIRLDGEKDSFGWVTCGVVMDGKLMSTTYY